MIKKTILLCAVAMLVNGCKSYDDEGSNNYNDVDVTFSTDAISVSNYVMSRASLSEESITDLYVWEGSTLLCHQVSTDADFGSPTISLSIGAHELTFVASKAEGQEWATGTGSDGTEQGIWSCVKVKDTFGKVVSMTVTGETKSQSVEMTRCNGKVMWIIEDAMDSNASTANITVTQCMGLDKDLNGVNSQTYTNGVNVTSVVGQTGITISTMVLPADHANGSTCTAKINIINGSNKSLCSYTNDVTVIPNQICNIHGSFFSGSNQSLMSVITEWGETVDYDLR